MVYQIREDWVDNPNQPPTEEGETPVAAADVLRWERGIAEAHRLAEAAQSDIDNLPEPPAALLPLTKAQAEAGTATTASSVSASVLKAAVEKHAPVPLALGTTAGTALAGDTALLKVGTTAGTALAGNTALLKVGTTADTALAGNTELLKLGSTATTAKPGNYAPPVATAAAVGTVKQGAAVADATDETDVVAQFNTLLASLRAAGIIAA